MQSLTSEQHTALYRRFLSEHRDPALADKVGSLLLSIWEKSLPLMRERLTILDTAATACEQGELDPDLREEATRTAHKLAGSLGIFGFSYGGELAGTLESLLLDNRNPEPMLLRKLANDLRLTIRL